MLGAARTTYLTLLRFANRVSRHVGRVDDQGHAYQPYVPFSVYAPWSVDERFNAVYSRVLDHTMVDELRCWELWTLVAETNKLEGDILEVGVWRGGTGALMTARVADLRSPSRVFLCDTFEGVVKAGPRDTFYRGGEFADTSPAIVEALLQSMGLRGAKVIKGVFPDQTGHDLRDARLRLVHIDVDVHDSASGVLSFVWPRLAIGGVVVFDDFGYPRAPGITRLVEEQRAQTDRLVLHNLNGHGLLIKVH